MDKFTRFIKKYPKQVDAAILIFGFIIGANLFIFFKQSGIDEETRSIIFRRHGFHYITPTLAGLFIGITLFVLEFQFFKHLSKYDRRLLFLLKLVIITCVILGTSLILQTTVNLISNGLNLEASVAKSLKFIQTDVFLSLYIYLILCGAIINFFRELSNRFGHGIIINYLSGKYREPVEENRVFMFLDLNRSTSIAEKLGHVKYGRFLNKCFSDLSEVLPVYEGEIYQYVGDEAVITWKTNFLSNPIKPILLHRAYHDRLVENKSEYLEKFGVLPYFKASINSGRVSVSMVGGTRKEMAFHGDVLNTAARVLELCSQLQKNVLITDSFARLLKGDHRVTTIQLKDIFLRGKADKTAIYQPIIHDL